MPFELYVDSLYTSPYALSTFVALTEKGLPFSIKTVDLEGGEQRQPAYAGRALTGRTRPHQPSRLAGHSATAASSQAAIHADPPMGVSMPSQRSPVRASA